MTSTSTRRLIVTIVAALGVIGGLLTGALASPAEAATASGTVSTNGLLLNMRTGPSTTTARKAMLPHNSPVTIVCQVPGQKIWGKVRTTNLWDRLTNGLYVSDAYVVRRATPPACPQPTGQLAVQDALAAPRAWVSPVPGTVGSGYRTKARPTHDGVDFSVKRNTPIQAVSAGTVTVVVCNASTGNCDVDGSVNIRGCGWYVEVEHPGQVVSRYCHMVRQPSVKVGQKVVAGQTLGYVGSSGNSSGPHLHFEIHTDAPPATSKNAVEPIAFMKSKGVVIPTV